MTGTPKRVVVQGNFLCLKNSHISDTNGKRPLKSFMIFCSPTSGPSFPSLLLAFYELLMRLGALLPRFLCHSSRCLCCSFPAAAPLAGAGHRGAARPPAARSPPEVPGRGPVRAGSPGPGGARRSPEAAGASGLALGAVARPQHSWGARGTRPLAGPRGWQGRGVRLALLPAPAHSSASAQAPPEAPSGIHILAAVCSLVQAVSPDRAGGPLGSVVPDGAAGHPKSRPCTGH